MKMCLIFFSFKHILKEIDEDFTDEELDGIIADVIDEMI